MEKRKRLRIILLHIIGDTPSFENLCVYCLKNRGKKHTTRQAMNDLWWLWCETYPDKGEDVMEFSAEHLQRIIDYIK
jgi:hypothetical protein